MPRSRAFYDFIDSLQLSKELLKLERSYRNPPPEKDRKIVQALRGSASVLMVASFEYFLRQIVEERLTYIAQNSSEISFDKLPQKIQICNIFNTLEQATKGRPFQDIKPKIDRIPEIKQACSLIIGETINPSAFNNTGSNPNSKTVNQIYKDVGINKIFEIINERFEKKWCKPIPLRFTIDKLDEIINRRHIVAHTADALNITRGELKESIRFLKILSELLDYELEKYIIKVIKNSLR